MSNTKKCAVVSVDNKSDLPEFLTGLLDLEWEIFGTSGTVDTYRQATGVAIGTISELITHETGALPTGRERAAQAVAELVRHSHIINLACINLRPPRLEPGDDPESLLSLDEGGIAMITAAVNSGTLIVTEPGSYEEVLDRLRSGEADNPAFKRDLQRQATAHMAKHLIHANQTLPG